MISTCGVREEGERMDGGRGREGGWDRNDPVVTEKRISTC
jgi:hypothetical protein